MSKHIVGASLFSSALAFVTNYSFTIPLIAGKATPITEISIICATLVVSLTDSVSIVQGNRAIIELRDNQQHALARVLAQKIVFSSLFGSLVFLILAFLYGQYKACLIGVVLGIINTLHSGPYISFCGEHQQYKKIAYGRAFTYLILNGGLTLFTIPAPVFFFGVIFTNVLFAYHLWNRLVPAYLAASSIRSEIRPTSITSGLHLATGRIPFILFFPSLNWCSLHLFSIDATRLISRFDLCMKILGGVGSPLVNAVVHSATLQLRLLRHRKRVALFATLLFVSGNLAIASLLLSSWQQVALIGSTLGPAFLLSVLYGNGFSIRCRTERLLQISSNIVFAASILIFVAILLAGHSVFISVFFAASANELLNLYSRLYILRWMKDTDE